MKIEEVEAHLDDHNIDGLEMTHSLAANSNPAEIIQKICVVYKACAPVLETLENLFFLPAKWRKAIKVLTSLLSSLCPTEVNG